MIASACSRRACSSALRTVKSLRLVSEVLRQEKLVKELFHADGLLLTCETLQERWKEWCDGVKNRRMRAEDHHRLLGSLKGTKTLFDEPCRACDKQAAAEAKAKWSTRALTEERFTAPAVLEDIKRRTRKLVGKDWWKRRKGRNLAYVPDQQGCAELERGCGGTLSVIPYDSEWPDKSGLTTFQRVSLTQEERESTMCRLGAAKTKGKVRVVTMQGAHAKRVLRPVHNAAYERLSRRFSWLVRGDVTEDHFKSVGELERGQSYISGDYSASTDNLNKDAVMAVVTTLAENLPNEEGRLLVASFRDCVVEWEGRIRLVVRGSMMGNLCSFVVLCILNRICFERALDLAGYSKNHPCILNGDDILFRGDYGLYCAWLHCTSEVGFVINEQKTMRSQRYGDLNSQTFDHIKGRKVKKLCFGFLGSDAWKEPVGSLCAPLFDLCRQVRFRTAAWLLTSYPIRSLLVRVPPELSAVPRRWWNFLVKKRWFRGIYDLPPTNIISTGVERKLPFVLGQPIESTREIEQAITDAEKAVTEEIVKEWRGVPVHPLEQRVASRTLFHKSGRHRLSRRISGWRRLWLEPVLKVIQEKYPSLFVEGDPVWVTDQPGLQVTYQLSRSFRRPAFRPPTTWCTEGRCLKPILWDAIPELTIDGVVLRCA